MASSVDARLMKSTKFPPEFSQKVDMKKVNLQVMKKWIASSISDILGSEDDVVIELCYGLIEGSRYPDIKALQIQLTGFLDKDTATFCKDLWKLLLSAQTSPQGVPKELLEAKKLELMQEKMEADRAAEGVRKRREDFDRRDREIADMKDRDRRDRGRGRGDGWQGRRGDRAFESRGRGGYNRGPPRSRSPEPRHGDTRGSHALDSYVPRGRPSRAAERGGRSRRSPSTSKSASSRSDSRSVSRSSSGSASPERRRSPGRYRSSRKRSRSPARQQGRAGRGDRNGRNGRHGRRRSRSASSERQSPTRKRRRYSSSRSRSPAGRRRRYSSSSSSRSRSPSSSRSRSRNASRSPGRGRRDSPPARRRRRNSSSPDSSPEDRDRARRQNREEDVEPRRRRDDS